MKHAFVWSLLSILLVNAGHLRQLDGDGNAVGSDSVLLTPDVKLPKNVVAATEGSLWRLRRDHDVVVIAVTQKYDCETCGDVLRAFATAAARFVGVKTVAFATLDATEEADEFHDLVNENPDFEWLVPALLVLKHDIQTIRRAPPFSFLINERTAVDLPKFVKRLVGPDIAEVESEAGLLARARDEATEGVSFAMWKAFARQKHEETFRRIAEEERLHTYFTSIAITAQDRLDESKLNPDRAPIVAYVLEKNGTISSIPFLVSVPTVALLRGFVSRQKTRRPGHEFDEITRVTTVDDDSAHCEQSNNGPGSRLNDRLTIFLTGTNLHTGNVFLPGKLLTVVVGAKLPNLPDTTPSSTFVGLCRGLKRTIAFPGGHHFGQRTIPMHVDEEDVIRFDIEVLEVNSSTDDDDREAAL